MGENSKIYENIGEFLKATWNIWDIGNIWGVGGLQEDHIKYLGVIVDSHLNWKHHILNVSKKISRSIGVMYRIRKYVDLAVLKSIYYSLTYSHIVYAIQVWGPATDSELDKILILQKYDVI